LAAIASENVVSLLRRDFATSCLHASAAESHVDNTRGNDVSVPVATLPAHRRHEDLAAIRMFDQRLGNSRVPPPRAATAMREDDQRATGHHLSVEQPAQATAI